MFVLFMIHKTNIFVFEFWTEKLDNGRYFLLRNLLVICLKTLMQIESSSDDFSRLEFPYI